MRFPAEQRPRLHDEEEDREGNEHERDDGVDEVAVHEAAPVDSEGEPAEVRRLDHRCDERGQEVGDERTHDGAEGRADHDADRQIDGIPAEQELFEFSEHTYCQYSAIFIMWFLHRVARSTLRSEWWTYRESDPRFDYAIVARYHYAIGPVFLLYYKFCGPRENRTPASSMRMTRNTTLL